jgi:serine/threonine protein kinase
MASVWLALDNQLSRPVALKEISADGAALREARAASAVCHPGVVQVYGVFRDRGREWIVMEALSGMTMRRALRDSGPLPAARLVTLGISLLQALQAIHRAGLVHGDVKPGNVQVLSTGAPVLIDFGLASQALRVSPETPFVAGSPPYMAPEVIRSGAREGASDLFSLGASLYEAATGCRPFEGATPVETAEAVLHCDPEPPLPGSAVGHVIEGLLVKDSRHRMDADQAQARLQEIRVGSISAPRPGYAVTAQSA